MRTSVISFDDRAVERLKRLAWHARFNARSEQEADQITSLVQAVGQGHVSARCAHEALSALRADQQATEAAA